MRSWLCGCSQQVMIRREVFRLSSPMACPSSCIQFRSAYSICSLVSGALIRVLASAGYWKTGGLEMRRFDWKHDGRGCPCAGLNPPELLLIYLFCSYKNNFSGRVSSVNVPNKSVLQIRIRRVKKLFGVQIRRPYGCLWRSSIGLKGILAMFPPEMSLLPISQPNNVRMPGLRCLRPFFGLS